MPPKILTITTSYNILLNSPVIPNAPGRDKQKIMSRIDTPMATARPKTTVSTSFNRAPATILAKNKIKMSTADKIGSTYKVRKVTDAITTAHPSATPAASSFAFNLIPHEKKLYIG